MSFSDEGWKYILNTNKNHGLFIQTTNVSHAHVMRIINKAHVFLFVTQSSTKFSDYVHTSAPDNRQCTV
jgi:hypothetical protein